MRHSGVLVVSFGKDLELRINPRPRIGQATLEVPLYADAGDDRPIEARVELAMNVRWRPE
jgi:hypothetical protein